MKTKSLLLSLCCLAATGASAQGFSYMFGEDVPDGSGDKKERLLVWFDTDLKYADKLGGGDVVSSVFNASGSDMISDAEHAAENADNIHGAILTPEMRDGIAFVTVPATTQYPSETAVTSGTVLFRLILGSKPNRINDVDNSWDAYLGQEGKECTGMYIGVQAPATATVTGILSTPAVDRKDGYGKMPRAAYFECTGALNDNAYTELTSEGATNDDAVIAYKPKNWDNGYCCKYVEVAVKNVKPGDVVGLRGVQTLYPGYTPSAMVAINEVEVGQPEAPAEYFNLQGMRVDASAMAGGIYICRQGGKATKVVVK